MAVNLIKTFEARMNSIFSATHEGRMSPFSIRKLAKRAAREMEAQTYEIDGINTAPALFTILVSASDDALMRSLYARLIEEIASFIEAKAQAKSYVFCAAPLVRFMVDPSLKSGKFSVFADNVDATTISKLRAEEDAFLAGSLGLGGAAGEQIKGEVNIVNPKGGHVATESQEAEVIAVPDLPEETPRVKKPTPRSHAKSAPAQNSDTPQNDNFVPIRPILDETSAGDFAPLVGYDLDESAGLNVIPENYAQGAQESISTPPISVATPQNANAEFANIASPNVALVNMRRVTPSTRVPKTQRRENAGARNTQAHTVPAKTSCLLVDRQSGETYEAASTPCIIGRERSCSNIVLRDPNISRKHAEMIYSGSAWYIRDLGSTNGTLVNGMSIDTCELHDGDVITLALTNLEFREI